MRRLADYCFMLRDWKLALSTYDILRTDFQNDKAWRHYAGAAEMAALSALMAPTPLSPKSRAENIDAWIEAASYSYTDRQRSAAPYYALRTLALSFELLRLRGASAADDAARWATRILETGLVGAVGHALITERISACYSVRVGSGMYKLGSRRRKAALWAVLAAQNWYNLGKSVQAERALDTALRLFNTRHENASGGAVKLPFDNMQMFVDELRQQIMGLRLVNQGFGADDEDGDEEGHSGTDDGDADGDTNEEGGPRRSRTRRVKSHPVEPEMEALDKSPHAKRKSVGLMVPGADLMGGGGGSGGMGGGGGPLSPAALERRPVGEVDAKGEGFE